MLDIFYSLGGQLSRCVSILIRVLYLNINIYLLVVGVPASRVKKVRFAFGLDKTGVLVKSVSCKVVQNEYEIAKIRNVLPSVS